MLLHENCHCVIFTFVSLGRHYGNLLQPFEVIFFFIQACMVTINYLIPNVVLKRYKTTSFQPQAYLVHRRRTGTRTWAIPMMTHRKCVQNFRNQGVQYEYSPCIYHCLVTIVIDTSFPSGALLFHEYGSFQILPNAVAFGPALGLWLCQC